MKKFSNDEKWIEEMYNYFVEKIWNVEKYKIKNKKSISAIFLAWAPWAWKTEFLETILYDVQEKFIIIDIDKYRSLFKWYNWKNSQDYQKCSVKVADKILKYCFKNYLNFVFDWTFRNFNKIKQNFWQCIKYERKVLLVLIFQEPRLSFYYTFLRKINKKRNVPIDVFIEWFYNSIENVFKALKTYKNLDLMIAYKKYDILDKDESRFEIDNNTKNIEKFCKKYFLSYRKGQFINKERLRLDIEKYNNILTQELLNKKTIWWEIRLYIIEKLLKLF